MHRLPGSSAVEWTLVQIDLSASLKGHPSALQDGRFLADFYICHPSDKRYNATNQRYWLHYHPLLTSDIESQHHTAHLIRPTAQSSEYARKENLRTFRQWIRITNTDTYIAGPFDFATINGRKTRDRISQLHWDVLKHYETLFTNELPSFTLPNYSVHFGQFHQTFTSAALGTRIRAYQSQPPTHTTV